MRVLDIIAYIEDNRSLYRGPDMTIEPVALIETRVTVGRSHIAMGHRLRCYFCPLALAVDDLLIEGYKALAFPTTLVIQKSGLIPQDNAVIPNPVKAIPLPPAAIQFMEDFDDGKPVSPKVFKILLPRHLLRNTVSPMEVRP